MQLQALAAMKRKTGKGQKPPRGIRAGVGLVGAIHSMYGGATGNIQTYGGWQVRHAPLIRRLLVFVLGAGEPPAAAWLVSAARR